MRYKSVQLILKSIIQMDLDEISLKNEDSSYQSELSQKSSVGRRGIKRSRQYIIKIKQILSHLITTIQNRPMRIKQVSKDISTLLQKQHPHKTIIEDTIKKRVYDVILVMNGIGLITKNGKKEFQITEQEVKKTTFALTEGRMVCAKKHADIQGKKVIVEKMEAFVQQLREKSYAQNTNKKDTVVCKGTIALVVDRNQFKMKNHPNYVKIVNVQDILSSLQLFAAL